MFKLILSACILTFLTACANMGGSTSTSSSGDRSTMGASGGLIPVGGPMGSSTGGPN